jgi:arylsulfatase A-like enzyme
MIVSMPKRIASDAVCKSPVGGVDLVPTFFSFAGLDLPWEMHGHDLTPLLKDPAAKRDEPVLTTLTGRKYGSDTNVIPTNEEDLYLNGVPWWISLVDGHHKYIRTLVEGQVEELYDLQADPAELDNLALKPAYAKRLAELRAATISELKRTKAGMVENLPSVKIAHN